MTEKYKKLLTIIIPHKNSPEYLEVLLSSIVKEADSKTTQIIVVDDNSTEKTEEFKIVTEKYNSFIEVYSNTRTNPGAGAARNVGLEHAEGKWLMFADADDCLLDGWYLKVKPYFDGEDDIVFFTPTSIDLKTNTISPRHRALAIRTKEFIDNPCQMNEDRLRFEFIVPWSKLIRYKLVKENDIWFDEVMYSNDVMFSVKVGYHANKIASSSETIYCVTVMDNSLTRQKSAANIFQRDEVMCSRYAFLKERISGERFNKLFISMQGYLLLRKAIQYLNPFNYNGEFSLKYLKLIKENKASVLPTGYVFEYFKKNKNIG